MIETTESGDVRTVAPWTETEVLALNRWQCSGWHPFTCGAEGCQAPVVDPATNRWVEIFPGKPMMVSPTLIATFEGWLCPACGYTQNWAHSFMLNPPPPTGELLDG